MAKVIQPLIRESSKTCGSMAQVALLSGDATVHQTFRMNRDLSVPSAAQDDTAS